MITLTRLSGSGFALNPDLIERADCTPDTVITLIDGTKYVVAESLREVAEAVREYRASLLAIATDISAYATGGGAGQVGLHAVRPTLARSPWRDTDGIGDSGDSGDSGGSGDWTDTDHPGDFDRCQDAVVVHLTRGES